MADRIEHNGHQGLRKKIIICFFILVAIFIISFFLGRYRIPFSDFTGIVGQLLTGAEIEQYQIFTIFYNIRLPRLILVTLTGTVLALAGASYQSIFHNPLVSPGILGVSAGACFGVALGLLVAPGSYLAIYLLAFIFGTLAVGFCYLLTLWGKGGNVMTMVLAGVIITSLFNALISLLKFVADPYEELPSIVYWLMGSFSNAGWTEVLYSLPIMLPGIIILLFYRWHLNVLSMGDEEALSLGINVVPVRLIIICLNTIMVAAVVATTGQVTWIGLVVPHMARFIFGSNHRYMLPAAALMGSSLLLVIDNLARTMVAVEIPISIISALIGTPFFAYLLITKRESGWN